MKVKREVHERTLKNIIAAVFLNHGIGKILHLSDMWKERHVISHRKIQEPIPEQLCKDMICL